MYLFYFDCGTSTTRGYLVQDGKVKSSVKRNIGSKDVSISNDNSILISAMREIYEAVLTEEKLRDCDINSIYASGMVTSPYGLVEVKHAAVPMDSRKMKENIYTYHEKIAFNRNIYLIPGLKTTNNNVTIENIDQINNVRGEEIEVLGIINHIPQNWKSSRYVIILPGSHTHSILMEGDTLLDIFSTFSGELFHAVTKSTILSDSTKAEDHFPDSMSVKMGCSNLKKYGLARSIYIVHAMKVFDVGSNQKRNDCLNAVINASAVQSLSLNIDSKWKGVKNIAVYGDERMLAIYLEAINHFIPELADKVQAIDRNRFNCAAEGLMSIISA